MTLCRDIMTTNVITCKPGDMITRAAQLMKSSDIGAIPVVEADDKLVGIVTDRDIAVRTVAKGIDPTDKYVATVMTVNPVTCHPNDFLETAQSRMSEHQVRRLPIVNQYGQIVGIIAQADLVLRSPESQKTEETIQEISQPDKP